MRGRGCSPNTGYLFGAAPFIGAIVGDVLEKVAKRGEISSITALVNFIKGEKKVAKSDLMKYSRIMDELVDYGYMARRRSGRVIELRVTEAGKAVYQLGQLISNLMKTNRLFANLVHRPLSFAVRLVVWLRYCLGSIGS